MPGRGHRPGEDALQAPLFVLTQAQLGAALVAAVSDLRDADLERWRADLAASSAAGASVCVSNLYVRVGRA